MEIAVQMKTEETKVCDRKVSVVQVGKKTIAYVMHDTKLNCIEFDQFLCVF